MYKALSRVLIVSSVAVALLTTVALAQQEPAKKVVIPALSGQPVQPKNPFTGVPSSHQQTAVVSVASTDGKYKLQTIGLDADNRVLALTGPPRTFGAPMKDAASELFVYSPEGKPITSMKVDFHANSVAAGPDGNLYLAGDGKIVKFSKDGKKLATIDLPHIADLLKNTDGLRKAAEETVKRQRESMQNIVKQYRERLKALEDKKEEDRTALEKRQLDQYRQIIKNYEKPVEVNKAQVDAIVNQMTGRLRTISSIAFSAKDVFIVCGDTVGYGYAVWRMDHEFKNPTKVLANLSGCCGQMDVQTIGDDLVVAENTKHRFARYSRDGKEVGAWGTCTTGADLECFGGCCNPMNVRGNGSGDFFTAECTGVIKRFSPKGDFLGVVAAPAMTGAGCRNMAFAVSRDESRVYFLDVLGSRFIVLSKK